MDKENTIGMFISVSFMAATLGIISGLIWSFSVGFEYKSGLGFGGLIGLGFGFLYSVYNKSTIKSGRYKAKEVVKTSGSMITGIFIISTFLAIIIGLIRWIFF